MIISPKLLTQKKVKKTQKSKYIQYNLTKYNKQVRKKFMTDQLNKEINIIPNQNAIKPIF